MTSSEDSQFLSEDADKEPSLFSNPSFIMFLIIRGGVIFGTNILTVSVGWHVYQEWSNVFDLGLVGLAQFAPFMFLFLISGLAADRFDRNRIMAVTGLIEGAVVALIALYFQFDEIAFWPILVLLAIHGSARAFYHPASQAVLPVIVPPRQFASAVALATSVAKVGQLAGPAMGGLLIVLLDHGSYWVSAAIFTFIGVLAMFIKLRENVEVTNTPRGTAVLEGFAYILRHPVLLGIISIDLIVVLFGGVIGLLPVFAIDILDVGPEWLGVMRAMPAAGALVVAAVLARSKVTSPSGEALFMALVVFGLAILVFSFSHILWLSILALAVYGGADMVSVYVRQTLVQTETPNELRGRVSAVNGVSIVASNELGDFRAGSMAAAFGAIPAVAIGGIVTLVTTGVWWVIFPALRRIRPSATT